MFITGRLCSCAPHLGLPEQLLQLLLRQQAVVLDKSGHFGRTLRLEVYGPVDLHVAMQSGQEGFLSLFGERERVVRELFSLKLLPGQRQKMMPFLAGTITEVVMIQKLGTSSEDFTQL